MIVDVPVVALRSRGTLQKSRWASRVLVGNILHTWSAVVASLLLRLRL
jgi:hypothetical protein